MSKKQNPYRVIENNNRITFVESYKSVYDRKSDREKLLARNSMTRSNAKFNFC